MLFKKIINLQLQVSCNLKHLLHFTTCLIISWWVLLILIKSPWGQQQFFLCTNRASLINHVESLLKLSSHSEEAHAMIKPPQTLVLRFAGHVVLVVSFNPS